MEFSWEIPRNSLENLGISPGKSKVFYGNSKEFLGIPIFIWEEMLTGPWWSDNFLRFFLPKEYVKPHRL